MRHDEVGAILLLQSRSGNGLHPDDRDDEDDDADKNENGNDVFLKFCQLFLRLEDGHPLFFAVVVLSTFVQLLGETDT